MRMPRTHQPQERFRIPWIVGNFLLNSDCHAGIAWPQHQLKVKQAGMHGHFS